MSVLAAVAAAAAAGLLVRPSARARARGLWDPTAGRSRSADAGTVVALGCVVASTVVVGWPWGTLAAGAVAPIVRERVNGRGRASTAVIDRQVPVALDLIAAALAAGRPPAAAVAAAGRALGGDTGAALDALALNAVSSADPASVWRVRGEHRDLAALTRAIARAERSGSAPAVVVARAADDLRRRRQADLTRRSRSGGVATAAPLGLCFLPAFFLVGVVPTILGLVGSLLG